MSFVKDDGPGVDFDDLHKVWTELSSVEFKILEADRVLAEYRAAVQREALHRDGRKPTVHELDKIVYYLGNSVEEKQALSKLSTSLATLQAERTKLKGVLDTMHKKIAVWQTKSANSRRTLLE